MLTLIITGLWIVLGPFVVFFGWLIKRLLSAGWFMLGVFLGLFHTILKGK